MSARSRLCPYGASVRRRAGRVSGWAPNNAASPGLLRHRNPRAVPGSGHPAAGRRLRTPPPHMAVAAAVPGMPDQRAAGRQRAGGPSHGTGAVRGVGHQLLGGRSGDAQPGDVGGAADRGGRRRQLCAAAVGGARRHRPELCSDPGAPDGPGGGAPGIPLLDGLLPHHPSGGHAEHLRPGARISAAGRAGAEDHGAGDRLSAA